MIQLTAFCFAYALVAQTAAQDAVPSSYRLPPAELVELLEAPLTPQVVPSPTGAHLLLVERAPLPRIEQVARAMLRLAGLRIDPVAHAPFQADGAQSLALLPQGKHAALPVPLPEGAQVLWTNWSHTGAYFAYLLQATGGSELWSCAATEPLQPRLLCARVNTILARPVWDADGRGLFCATVPENLGAPPPTTAAPDGPIVQETHGETSPLRTYQDLLASSHDEALFEHYATSEIVHVDCLSGARDRLEVPLGLYSALSPAPDGRWLLLSCYHRPYSYLMPWSSFAHHITALEISGERRVLIADIPLEANVPIEGVPTGPRMVQWKPLERATLVWAEALDGGDPAAAAEFRDRWLLCDLTGDGQTREILRTKERATGLTWFGSPELVLATEYDRERRWTRSLLHNLAAPVDRPRVLEDRSVRDRYADPGRIVSLRLGGDLRVALLQNETILRAGDGASPTGPQPFLDRQDLKSGASERLWQCTGAGYESFAQLLPELGEGFFLTRHESPSTPPNWMVRQLGETTAQAWTRFADPQPEIRGVEKRLLSYTRDDGVALSATLYLPSGYVAGTRLPLFVWAYPLEFNDAATAGQVAANPQTFTEIRGSSHLTLLTRGWAVLDGATMPIVGDPERMNDTFIEQLVASARAAVEAAVAAGVADPARVAVGGHSYGAFMTANLLAHSDLFRAGIARSGAYNRSLTPFGFQAERRTLWQAPDIYVKLSPFFHADKIDEPLLLVHGAIDDNSGTFPMQSERLYQAIKGQGGHARLVILPAESHGYRARESILHLQAETLDWLDQHVKYAEPRAAGLTPGTELDD